MYVRQLAWLSAPIDKGVGKKRIKGPPRSETIDEPDLPDRTWAEHLIDYLFELGIASGSGESLQPVTWTEVNAWAAATNTRLSAWELATIRGLSSQYVTQYLRAKDPDCPAPYSVMKDTTDEQRKRVAEKFKKLFDMRATDG